MFSDGPRAVRALQAVGAVPPGGHLRHQVAHPGALLRHAVQRPGDPHLLPDARRRHTS